MSRRLTPRQKRAAMRSAPEEDPEFQIAPMIDILLVLLVFFMSISSTEVLQTNDSVQLPVARDAKDKDKSKVQASGQTVINVLWSTLNNQGALDVDSQAFQQAAEFVPYLKKKLDANPNLRVLVRADKNVKYEYMRSLLAAVGQAGVQNVTFSVVDKDQAAPAPAAGH